MKHVCGLEFFFRDTQFTLRLKQDGRIIYFVWSVAGELLCVALGLIYGKFFIAYRNLLFRACIRKKILLEEKIWEMYFFYFAKTLKYATPFFQENQFDIFSSLDVRVCLRWLFLFFSSPTRDFVKCIFLELKFLNLGKNVRSHRSEWYFLCDMNDTPLSNKNANNLIALIYSFTKLIHC